MPLYPIFCPDCYERESEFSHIIHFNDTFRYFSLLIFDRFGLMVFSSGNQFEEWNGQIQGTTLNSPEGYYYYLITYVSGKGSGIKETMSGSFKLIRRN